MPNVIAHYTEHETRKIHTHKTKNESLIMTLNDKRYVQYGCGLSAPKEWINFDASPTLRLQKIPILGHLIKKKLNVVFPGNVKYGDIVKGLPIQDACCDGVYCSHVLEHLSLADFRLTLANTYKLLKKGGKFRCVLPDLEFAVRKYISDIENNIDLASVQFIRNTLIGTEKRPRGMKAILSVVLGNSNHLWMWDEKSLAKELKDAGFINIRVCKYNDSEDKMFFYVEDEDRFSNAVAIECEK